MNDGPTAPPGWYPDQDGRQRYWDGHEWTHYTADNYWDLRDKKRSQTGSLASANGPDMTRGSRKLSRKPWHRMWQVWLGALVLSCSGLGLLGNAVAPKTDTITATGESSESSPSDQPSPKAAQSTPRPERIAVSAQPKPSPTKKAVPLLFVSDQKDGDSWVASDGNEYRLGLVNAPELNEPCSSQATAFTRQFLASGFTVDDYSTDTYGRHVAEVFNKSGASLNVALAKSGLGNDKYLDQFRHENPDLARRLDQAFASATSPSCEKATAPVPLVQKPTPTPQATAYVAPPASSSGGDSSAGSGAHAVCRDGSLSYSQHRSGTCSHHGGVAKWLW